MKVSHTHQSDLVKKAFERISPQQYAEKLDLNLQSGLALFPGLVPVAYCKRSKTGAGEGLGTGG